MNQEGMAFNSNLSVNELQAVKVTRFKDIHKYSSDLGTAREGLAAAQEPQGKLSCGESVRKELVR